MMCFNCGNEDKFEIKECKIIQVYKRKKLSITTPLTICKKCKTQLLGKGQCDELIKRTKREYENKI